MGFINQLITGGHHPVSKPTYPQLLGFPNMNQLSNGMPDGDLGHARGALRVGTGGLASRGLEDMMGRRWAMVVTMFFWSKVPLEQRDI